MYNKRGGIKNEREFKFVFFIGTILFCLVLCADVIILTTGEKLEGEIITEDEESVTLKKEYGRIIVEKKFIKSIEREGEKRPEAEKKDDEKEKTEKTKLKWRLERWMESRKNLGCSECGGDGKEKCPHCKGSRQQPADPHSKTMRG
ncbi:MAG: hypothetical protein N2234_07135 [Planctomycetota bacterium]|nr:hypothetical protein [Planctomycetota bacterium]